MLYKLKRDINMLEQEDISVMQYFSKLRKMWDELILLRLIPSCRCGAMKECDRNAI